MRVAIDCGPAASEKPSGIGRYAQLLMDGFAARATAKDRFDFLYPASKLALTGTFPEAPHVRKRPYSRGWLAPLYGLGSGADVLLTTQPFKPALPGVPVVSTIHDLHLLHGINPDSASKAGRREAKALRALVAHSRRLIAISRHVRDDLIATLAVDPARIRVVPQALDRHFQIDPAAARAASIAGLPSRPYFLLSSENRPSKNFARMLEAYMRSGMAASHDLAVTGAASGAAGAALQSIAAAGGVAERIHLLGYRPYAELPAIFAQSAGLLFASLNEGFGLPIIEAMAMEVPVLTSTVTSCPETAGGHAVLVDPMSVEDIAAGIRKLPDVDADRRAAARRYAAAFTPEATTAATLAVLREVLR